MRKVLTPSHAGPRSMAGALAVALVASVAAAACGGESADGAADRATRPTVVVTTSVWGDIVDGAVGELADVEVVMPLGADPHDFAPSPRQAELMEQADLVVVNGLGLEEALTSVVERVEATGTPVVRLGDSVETIESATGGVDPHIWLDPGRVSVALRSLGDDLVANSALTADAVDSAIEAYVALLDELDAEIAAAVAAVPPERRLLVTNHDSYGYFAERYGFEVVGTVIPSNTTSASPSSSDLVELAERIRTLRVPAVFAETTESDELAQALAGEAGSGVVVVQLNGGSLGPPGSGADDYPGLMRTDAALIVDALATG